MKLLFVDDEPVIVNGLAKLMDYSELGFKTVHCATSAKDALEILRSAMPDVIVSDVVMPGMTGLELLRALRKHQQATKVIFLSGYPNFSFAQEAIALGASDYLVKPVDAQLLAQRLKEAVESLKEEREKDVLSSKLNSIAQGEAIQSLQSFTKEQPHPFCLLILMRISDIESRSTLENNLLRFSVYAKVEGYCKSYTATTFIKDAHLLIVMHGEVDLVQQASELVDKLRLLIGESFSIEADFECSETLDNTQLIPSSYQQLVSKMEARDVVVKHEQSAIERIKAHMRLHYHENLTLEVLADMAAMNASYLSAYFRKQTGVGFKEYLTQLRIEAAQRLIIESDLRIYEIAERVGFSDPKYFSETFRRLTGETPQSYRDARKRR